MLTLFRNFLSGLPYNLRRVTSGRGFIGEIDGLRFLAILPVVLQHFSERVYRGVSPLRSASDTTLADIFSHGHIGVYIFFAISGFILALPFGRYALQQGSAVSLKTYYIRRLTRLEPPFLLVMTLFFLILVFLKNENFQELFPHFLASCFYLHRIIYGEWSPINPPTWTLEIEVQFYILAPFLAALLFRISNKFIRRLSVIVLIVIKIVLANTTSWYDDLRLTLPYVIEFFLIGVLMADVFLTEWKDEIPKSLLFDFLAVISIITVFCTWTWDKNLSWKFVFAGALFMTFYSCFRSIYVSRFFSNPWLTAIGGMCYSIYLIHLGFAEFFASFLKRITPFNDFTTNCLFGLLLFLPALFIISTIFFLAVEKPCMDPKWPQKLSARIKGTF